jgi:hypothetical protein
MNQLTSMQQINVNKIHKANQTNQIKIGRKYSMKTKQTSPPLIVVCLCKFVRRRRQWKPQREVRRFTAGTRRWRWTSAVQTRVPTHRIEGKGASEELPRLMGKEGWRAASAERAGSCWRVSWCRNTFKASTARGGHKHARSVGGRARRWWTAMRGRQRWVQEVNRPGS